jgi:hypothetical protein
VQVRFAGLSWAGRSPARAVHCLRRSPRWKLCEAGGFFEGTDQPKLAAASSLERAALFDLAGRERSPK